MRKTAVRFMADRADMVETVVESEVNSATRGAKRRVNKRVKTKSTAWCCAGH